MWKISLSDLRLTADDHAAVMEALQSNWLTMGPRTADFEQLLLRRWIQSHRRTALPFLIARLGCIWLLSQQALAPATRSSCRH